MKYTFTKYHKYIVFMQFLFFKILHVGRIEPPSRPGLALNQIRECVCEEHKHMYCMSRTGILKQADWHFQRMGLWELILVAQLVLNFKLFFCNLLFFFFFRVFFLLGKDGWTDSTQSHCMAGRIPALRCHFPFGNLSSYLFSLAAQTLTS